jgi:hypothetical protein
LSADNGLDIKAAPIPVKFDVSIDSMRYAIAEGGKDGIKMLGIVEIAVLGMQKELHRAVIANDIINRGGSIPSNLFDWVEKLSPYQLRDAKQNFVQIRNDIAGRIPHGLFRPTEGQLLLVLDYVVDGER